MDRPRPETPYADAPEPPTHAIVLEAAASTAPWTRLFALETFRYARTGWWLDAVMPHEPRLFLIAALLLPLALWGLGWALAPDPAAWLAAPDVSGQPPFLSAHLVALRVLGSLFSRGLAPSLSGLGMDEGGRRQVARGLFGVWPNLGAVAAAAFWIARDTTLSLVPGAEGLTAFDDPDQWDLGALGGPHQVALLVVWNIEWLAFGMILWVQLWSMLSLSYTIRRVDFGPHLRRIMVRNEYRDFFALIAKNATVCAAFAAANLAFVAYTGELVPKPERVVADLGDFLTEMADLTSVALLFLVVIAGYVGYVFLIRRALTQAIDAAYAPAGDALLAGDAEPDATADPPRLADHQRLRARVEATVVLLRAITFQREVDALGGRGLTTLLLKALPVLGTVALRIYTMITASG